MNQYARGAHKPTLAALLFRYSFTVLICLLGISSHASASPDEQWQKANNFYQQKQYDSAVIYFENIAAAKPADAAVFYNLGNTYYRLNKIGPAVLNYQRALKRKPDYKEASENLALTQSRIPGNIQPAQDIFFVKWWHGLTAPGLIMVWSVISLLLFMGMIGLLLYRRLQKGKVYIRPQIIGAICILWLLTLFLALCAAKATMGNIQAVVMQDGVSLSATPGKAGKALQQLPEGTTVRTESVKDSWVQISLIDGRTGWVPQNTIRQVD